jgi:hypothetical protein
VAIAFNKYADGAGKGNAAQVIFKKSVEEVMPFLNDLYENLDRTGSLTAQQAKDAEDLAKAWNKLAIEASNLGRSMVVDLAPGLTAVLRGFSRGGFIGGIGAAEGVVRPLEEIEKAFKNASKPILDAGSVGNASALDRLNYQYWQSAVETARARAFEQNFVGPPSDLAGRPQLKYAGPTGDSSTRKAGLSDLQKFEQRIFKERMDMLDAEGEEAQRLWLEKFERERTLDEYKKAQHLEEMAQQRELDEYYRTGGEEAAREYREADDKRRAEESYRATVKAADDAKREWERTSQGITDSLTDALLRGFEGGADAAKNFVQTLKNLFATLVLRPIIQPITQAGANIALGALGMGASGAASAADLFGIGSAINGITGGAGIGGAVATGLEALGASSGVATGWGAFAGAAMPYVAAAALLYSAFKPARGGPKTRGDAVGAWQSDYARLVQQLGGTAGSFSPYLQYEADPRGTASTSIYSGLAGAGGDLLYQVIGRDVGRDEAALQAGLIEEYNRMLVAALKASDLPRVAREVFDAIDPATASAQALAEALQRVTTAAQGIAVWGNIARDIAQSRLALAGSPNLSPLSNEGKLSAAGGAFSEQFRRAVLLGEQGAYGGLAGSAQEYLQAARGYYASGPEYAAIYGRVQKWLEEAQNSALRAASMDDLVAETRLGNQANEAGLTALLAQLQSIDARLASIESSNALAAAA